jgi:hypothetical protein
MVGDNNSESAGLRGERLQVMLTQEELRALDDFRFKRRMPSRAAAIRELLRRGLAADGFAVAPDGAKSKQFGVVSDTGNSNGRGGSGSNGHDGNGSNGRRAAGKP